MREGIKGMVQFEARTTCERFHGYTEQYLLFRRAQEVRRPAFRVILGAEAAVAAAAVAMAVLGRGFPWLYLAAAAVIIWSMTRSLQGADTRNYIRRARQNRLSPEDAAKEMVISFDETGCTLSAPGNSLPGGDAEERRLFSYGQVSGLFVSEDYLLVASKEAGSVCFAKADLTVGAPEELIAFLERSCGRQAAVYRLNTARLQALLR